MTGLAANQVITFDVYRTPVCLAECQSASFPLQISTSYLRPSIDSEMQMMFRRSSQAKIKGFVAGVNAITIVLEVINVAVMTFDLDLLMSQLSQLHHYYSTFLPLFVFT